MRRLLLVLLPIATSACFAPWAVMAGGFSDFGRAPWPPRTEIVQVALANGQRLRGAFVPAGPDAPVVLHLLDATNSATLGCLPYTPEHRRTGNPALWDLQDLGFASLILDYRGVGASDGERSVEHLIDDARVMYREAVRRAGDDESRVCIRSISMGTIAAAALIREGIRPAQWTLIAPVEGQTVVYNVMTAFVWDPLVWMLGWLAQPLAEVDVAGALTVAPCRTLLLAPSDDVDGFTTAEETTRFRRAVRTAKGDWQPIFRGHVGCIQQCAELQAAERQQLASLPCSPRLAAARAEAALAAAGRRQDRRTRVRLELLGAQVDAEPALAVAAAMSEVPLGTLIPWVRWLDRLPQRGERRRTVAEWLPVFDLQDPAGPLRPDAIAEMATWLCARQWRLGDRDPIPLLQHLRADGYDYAAFLRSWFGADTGVEYGGDVVHRVVTGGGHWVQGVPSGEAMRRAARSMRKAIGAPDDVAAGAVPGRLVQSGTLGLGYAAVTPEPDALHGADVERLAELFLLELDPWTLARLQEWPDWSAQVRLLVREVPHVLEAPVFFAHLIREQESRILGMPLEWVRLHAPRIRAMPPEIQHSLAVDVNRFCLRTLWVAGERESVLQRIYCNRDFATGHIVPPDGMDTLVGVLENGAQDKSLRCDRTFLTLAGLPSQVIEYPVKFRIDGSEGELEAMARGLQVWWNGRWIPYPGPLR
ncbi:MAG: alpha/beta hydrolase [Planctomycetes bacterium]|nr:alpha/beta hydrolase [Planctomycetota bacterium]